MKQDIQKKNCSVELLEETGYMCAVEAMRLSRRSIKMSDSVDGKLGIDDMSLMIRLMDEDDISAGDPHAVALRMIHYTFKIKAPLYWWKQMDRYTIGKTQSSDSTMYNIMSTRLSEDDFTDSVSPMIIHVLNFYIGSGAFDFVVQNLPSGYLQTRVVQFSLPTLRRILLQRYGHKLEEWMVFRRQVLRQVQYPDLLWRQTDG
jgi:hypothetical protein